MLPPCKRLRRTRTIENSLKISRKLGGIARACITSAVEQYKKDGIILDKQVDIGDERKEACDSFDANSDWPAPRLCLHPDS